MSVQTVLFDSVALTVVDNHCDSPRSTLGPNRGGEASHLALLTQGSFVYQRGRRGHLADPNCAVLHRAPDEYRVSHPSDHGDDGTFVALSPALTDEVFPPGAGPEFQLSPRTQLAHATLRAHWRRFEEDRLDREESTLGLLACLLDDSRALKPVRSSVYGRRLVARARSRLAEQPETNLSLDGLAREFCCSPFHLMRLFHAHTGRTVRAHRRQLRVAAALEHLQHDTDLSTLAHQVGFASHSHLSASFKAVLGRSPSQVRATLFGRAGC